MINQILSFNQIAIVYTNYSKDNGFADIITSNPIVINCRAGIETVVEVDSQGENKYNKLYLHCNDSVEIKEGYCVVFNNLQYEVRTVSKTYNIEGTESFYYLEGYEQQFTLFVDDIIFGGNTGDVVADIIFGGNTGDVIVDIIEGGSPL